MNSWDRYPFSVEAVAGWMILVKISPRLDLDV
jgi:hypothetical protein